jgi:hypothetical protein
LERLFREMDCRFSADLLAASLERMKESRAFPRLDPSRVSRIAIFEAWLSVA